MCTLPLDMFTLYLLCHDSLLKITLKNLQLITYLRAGATSTSEIMPYPSA